MRALVSLLAVPAFAAFSGTALAQTQADAYYPPEEMAAARAMLRHETGGARHLFFRTDRFEIRQQRDDEEALLWDIDAWYGGAINRLWLKSEAEYSLDHDEFEELEVQALYSRAISPFFNLQTGIRHDFEPDTGRTHAVLGVQGEAPYWFEIDAALFLSDEGELTGALETEYELRLTQRLILQPRAELTWSAVAIPELGVGSGFGTIETGLRLRYEIRRQFAPYAGVEWSRQLGDTGDFVRAAGGRTDDTALVAGLRVWF
ncbi:MAG: copper resistance protein B [Pseudomonadota bacterium]|nr:copper resistance protein B [Pseudomonadota bacterium]